MVAPSEGMKLASHTTSQRAPRARTPPATQALDWAATIAAPRLVGRRQSAVTINIVGLSVVGASVVGLQEGVAVVGAAVGLAVVGVLVGESVVGLDVVGVPVGEGVEGPNVGYKAWSVPPQLL